MHELGIATNLVEIVEQELARYDSGRVVSILLRVGALTDLDAESLLFAFKAITAGTRLVETRLEIETVPITVRCDECGELSSVDRYLFCCDHCSGQNVTMVSGAELDIVSFDIDTSEASNGEETANTEARI